MIYFILMIIAFIAFLIYGIVLLIKEEYKYPFIKNIKNKYLKLFISILPILIIFVFFNFINVSIILTHLILFFWLGKIFIKLFIKKPNIYLNGLIAVILTITYLGIGYYNDYHIRETNYLIETKKDINDLKILAIADAHIGATFTGETFYNKMQELSKINCDLFVIVGDFVDDDTKKIDMQKSIEGLSLIKAKYGTYFVHGNHDKGYFKYRDFTVDDLETELQEKNIIILKDDIKEFNDFYLIGRRDHGDPKRINIKELTKDLNKQKYIIDLNHEPNDYEKEKNNVDLVISGHTHGGQLFPIGQLSVLMGVNDEYYGHKKIDNTDYLVTSGISNWAMDFKTGTSSEYVIVTIKKAS